MKPNLRRVLPRLRFRTNSLLWLVVVVAAFFVGRQSSQNGGYLTQSFYRIWPSAAALRFVPQKDGTMIITDRAGAQKMWISDATVCTAVPTSSDRGRLTPGVDGIANVHYWRPGATTPFHSLIVVEQGKMMHMEFAYLQPRISESPSLVSGAVDVTLE